MRKIFLVEGDSMTPLLQSGDRILVRKMKQFKVGDIVVSRHPIQADLVIVKQIESIDPHGRLKLVGLNASSTHRFGLVKKELVYGKVVSFLSG